MKLILGTMTFGESVFRPDVDVFINAFLDAGYDELDTAYVYNDGNCEKFLGEVLPGLKRPFKICTKVNPRITGKLDAEAAYMQLSTSLERLTLPSVDTVFLHFPDPATPVESVLSAMAEMHNQGKFKELGLSNYPAWMVAEVWHICDQHGWVKPTVYEGVYNPLTRGAEQELNDCLNHYGLRFYAYNPTMGGMLTGRYKSVDEAPTDGRFTHRPGYQGKYWMFFASTFWKKLQAKMEKVESPKRRKLQAFTVDSYKRLRELDTLPPSSSSVKRLARRILARTGLRYSTILLTDLPSCVRGL